MSIFACSTCGDPAIAIAPGTAPETCELLGMVLILQPGERSQSWCLGHWPASWKATPQTAGEIAKHFQPKNLEH